jgi:hypothetical protein
MGGGWEAEMAVVVGPVPGGWSVRADRCAQPMMFLSGGRAERQARAIALRLAAVGHDARVDVRDRNGRIAGSVRYRASIAIGPRWSEGEWSR